jgi:crotonobetainyl-CoA:carnitine CoA-transferase CaiB-like acyl-CoA transferase
MPILRERLAHRSAAEAGRDLFERVGLPFAPIRKPEELFDDEHLRATGGLADTVLMPLTLDGQRPPVRLNPPRLGEHTETLMAELGYAPDEIAGFTAALPGRS